ncbi:heme lyase CcmF/NrfE family subunit [Bartonella sp. DGB1]|uniref:heme lyase CcmF/NrfE family subunit n=1 Tax=Bartonella sp. DGB1 TaxID=3239807 RepID=UPI00352553D2
MIIELGHFLLILSFSLSIILAIFPIIGVYWQKEEFIKLAFPLIGLISVALFFSLLTLHYSYLVSDFSVKNIFENSSVTQPLLFKVIGVWSNHEGSMFLWVVLLALYSLATSIFTKSMDRKFKALFLAFQGWLLVAFLAFLIFTSNPFIRLEELPLEGMGLNPLLQDIGLLLHPPLLYLGYVGLSVCFSFAIIALLRQEIDKNWAVQLRPWIILSWIFLTSGIGLGSYWAYYELGWGGFWYWDPVENASIMPWLTATALIHSILVMVQRGILKIWTIFLAIVSFSFALLGAFLVRSGVLISVHNFTVDPVRGLFILLIFSVFVGGAFILFALRANGLKKGGLFAPISKETTIVLNNFLLLFIVLSIFIGTFYPLIIEALTGEQIFVGPPFFNMILSIFAFPLFLLLPFSLYLSWKKGKILKVIKALTFIGILTIIIIVWILYKYQLKLISVAFFIGLAIWIIAGSLSYFISRSAILKDKHRSIFRKVTKIPLSIYGFTMVHMGLGVTLLGIIVSTNFGNIASYEIKIGQEITFMGRILLLKNIEIKNLSNYSAELATFSLKKDNNTESLNIERRYFRLKQMYLVKTAQYRDGLTHFYLVLEGRDKDKLRITLYYKPLVLAIWLGAIFMILGGFLVLIDKRWRIKVEQDKI